MLLVYCILFYLYSAHYIVKALAKVGPFLYPSIMITKRRVLSSLPLIAVMASSVMLQGFFWPFGGDEAEDEAPREPSVEASIMRDDENPHTEQWFDLKNSNIDVAEEGEVKSRPTYWPEQLERPTNIKKGPKDLSTDCVVRNYNFEIDQTVGANIGNLEDAEVHCNVKVLRKVP